MPRDTTKIASFLKCVRYADVGTALPAITSSPVTWPSSPGAAANEVQSVTLANATGGTFTLSYAGQTTAAIAYNALSATVEGALEDLSTIGEGNVMVTGTAATSFMVTFRGVLGNTNVPALTYTSSLTGSGPTITIVEVTPGSAGGGVWSLIPTEDGDKGVKINPDAVTKLVRLFGSARPAYQYVLSSAFKEIAFTVQESGYAAMKFAFPAYADYTAGDVITLSAKSILSPCKAIAIEGPLGVFHFPNMTPDHDVDLTMDPKNVTSMDIKLINLEDSNGNCGRYYRFTS